MPSRKLVIASVSLEGGEASKGHISLCVPHPIPWTCAIGGTNGSNRIEIFVYWHGLIKTRLIREYRTKRYTLTM